MISMLLVLDPVEGGREVRTYVDGETVCELLDDIRKAASRHRRDVIGDMSVAIDVERDHVARMTGFEVSCMGCDGTRTHLGYLKEAML